MTESFSSSGKHKAAAYHIVSCGISRQVPIYLSLLMLTRASVFVTCITPCTTLYLSVLQDEDIQAEMTQCGLKSDGSKAQDLAQLFKVLEQHDFATPETEATTGNR